MKFSIFNVFTELDNSNYILTNTLSGGMYKIDKETKFNIVNNFFEKFTEQEIQSYINNGILVEDYIDEIQIYSYFSNKFRYTYDSLNITMLLTNDCNFKCTYCFQEHKRDSIFMSQKTLFNIVDYIKSNFEINKNLKKLNIVLFGGEPLLKLSNYCNFFDELKKFCNDNNYIFSTQVVTNGSLINKNNLEILHDNNCNNIQITLDGIKSVHNITRKFRNGRGTFDSVIAGIKEIKNYCKLPLPVIRVNLSEQNYDNIIELIDYLYINDLSDCFLDFGVVFDSYNSKNNYTFNEETIKGKFLDIWRYLKNKGFKFNYKPVRKFLYCGAYCENYITIDVDGSLYKCWDLVKNENYKIGDISNTDNINIAKYSEWINRDEKVRVDCNKCEYLPVCGYGCANLSYQNSGDVNGLGCNFTKWIYDDQIKFIYEGGNSYENE